MSEQLDLLASVRPYTSPKQPTGSQHYAVLQALLNEGERGLTGEECAQRCGFRASHIATTRLGEMAVGGDSDRFPVPLVFHSEKKDRPTASGRNAYRWFLTDAGAEFAAGIVSRRSA